MCCAHLHAALLKPESVAGAYVLVHRSYGCAEANELIPMLDLEAEPLNAAA